MKKHLIDKIEINKFRSFSPSEKIVVNNLNIFSGKNNVGKSNVLKVLNLFFNKQTGFNEFFDFDKDYNKGYSGNRGHNNEIIITVFFTGNHTTSKILKEGFAIRKRYIKDSDDVEITYFILKGKNKDILKEIKKSEYRKISSFNKFYNRIKYIYVPAIRDKFFITHIFTYLEEILELDPNKSYQKSFNDLTSELKTNTVSIEENFKKFINVNTSIEAPQKIKDILSGIRISLEQNYKVKIKTSKKDAQGRPEYKLEKPRINITSSGDGIMMSYIPHFLNFLTKKLKNNHFIWGFEEPENSLEYSKVQTLAHKFLTEFSKINQIFLTTHSPAFINLKNNSEVNFFRVYKLNSDRDSLTKIQTENQLQKKLSESVSKNDLIMMKILNEEIHHVDLSNEISAHVSKIIKTRESLQREFASVESLKLELANLKPAKVFIYEDKNSLNFWKSCLSKFGVEIKNIKFLCSGGCTNTSIETSLAFINKEDSTYKPKVYRLNDSDGFLKKKYKTIIESEFSKKHNYNYKFKLLPVCEIENFEILNNLEIFKEWFEKLDVDEIINFSDKTKSTLENNYSSFARVINHEIFEYSKINKHIAELMSFNKLDKLSNFAGKDIIKKANSDKLKFKPIIKTEFDQFPKKLKLVLADIKEFFKD